MCRWITLISSDNVSLSDIVLAPSNSLIQLARDASFHPSFDAINNATMNGDGFGIGWYHTNVAICPTTTGGVANDGSISVAGTAPRTPERKSPTSVALVTGPQAAVYRDIYPAWNNHNLREICMATNSNCIMAHVRAASKGAEVSHLNCHPFKAGRLMFCHNGRIPEFAKIRRHFINKVSDAAFPVIRGTTDSECIFGLILTFLERDGAEERPAVQKTGFGHKRLVAAVKRTLRLIETTLEECGIIDNYSTCNFSLTDGDTMVVTRFCDKSPEIPPPSLYFAYGNAQELYHELTAGCDPIPPPVSDEEKSSTDSDAEEDEEGFAERQVEIGGIESRPGTIMTDVDPLAASFIVASNPLTKSHTWHPMPRNSIMWCTRSMHPELRLLKRARKSTLPSGVLPY